MVLLNEFYELQHYRAVDLLENFLSVTTHNFFAKACESNYYHSAMSCIYFEILFIHSVQ